MGPLQNLEQWDEFVQQRYDPERKAEDFRNYENTTPGVREFYRLNHLNQTHDFAVSKKRQYAGLTKTKMGIWEALEYLNTLVDDSDPDTDLSQIEHNLQTAEAIRRDGHPDWFQLTGLVHDLGKVLCLAGPGRNGRWSATLFRPAARTRIKSCSTNFSRRTRIRRILCIRSAWVIMSRTAGSTRWT